jgi:hypothetical protein
MKPSSETTVKVLTEKIRELGVAGVRPFSPEETQTLTLDPLALLLAPRNTERDNSLRKYYCLQDSLGNLPQEARARHGAFFKWLGCGSKQKATE